MSCPVWLLCLHGQVNCRRVHRVLRAAVVRVVFSFSSLSHSARPLGEVGEDGAGEGTVGTTMLSPPSTLELPEQKHGSHLCLRPLSTPLKALQYTDWTFLFMLCPDY